MPVTLPELVGAHCIVQPRTMQQGHSALDGIIEAAQGKPEYANALRLAQNIRSEARTLDAQCEGIRALKGALTTTPTAFASAATLTPAATPSSTTLTPAQIRETFCGLGGSARMDFFRKHEAVLMPKYVNPRAKLFDEMANLPPGEDHEFFKKNLQHKST